MSIIHIKFNNLFAFTSEHTIEVHELNEETNGTFTVALCTPIEHDIKINTEN